MRRITGVLVVLLSMFGLAGGAEAQQDPSRSSGRQTSEFSLEQNYPNPFSADTRIPFTLGESLFAEGRSVVVSMRVLNLLQQFVAAPSALRHAAGEGVPLVQLDYGQPGRYEAYWDGRDQNGRSVSAGMYWVQLTVNGESRGQRVQMAR